MIRDTEVAGWVVWICGLGAALLAVVIPLLVACWLVSRETPVWLAARSWQDTWTQEQKQDATC